jgi:hypothetical protein
MLATPSDNANLNVSTFYHGLVPRAPNNVSLFFRGDGFWVAPAQKNTTYYIRQRICDSPLSPSDFYLTNGAGAAITTGVKPGTADAGHPGIWSMASGTSNNGSIVLISANPPAAEFNLSVVARLAYRFVFKTGAAIPAYPNARYTFGWVDSGGTLTPSNIVAWRFLPGTSPNWLFSVFSGASGGNTASTAPAVAANTWYDARIYWDSTGVTGKIGVYGGTLYATAKITAGVPASTVSMYWQHGIQNEASGTTSYTIYPNLYEIVGPLPVTGSSMLLGDNLVNFF